MKKTKILLIDDEKATFNAISIIFAPDKYEINYCKTASEGCALVKNKKFDVILLDMLLPSENGLTTLDAINKKTSQKNVIILSAIDSAKTIREAFKRGCHDYIVKPFDPEILLSSVFEIIQPNSHQKGKYGTIS